METVVRVFAVYLFLMLALRLLGKREFGELAPFDLVVLLLIPEVFQQAIVGEDFSMTNAVVAASTLFTLVMLTSLLSYRWKRVGDVIGGRPIVLASEGILIPEAMDRERVSPDEVIAAVRDAGLEEMWQVKFVILQSDGRLAVVPWARTLPVHETAQQHRHHT
jgi:uncharacterized membrane protein YcaP (DUF421 family)